MQKVKYPAQAQLLGVALDAKDWGDRKLAEKRLSTETGLHLSLVQRYVRGEVSVGAKNASMVARALGLSIEAVLAAANAFRPATAA